MGPNMQDDVGYGGLVTTFVTDTYSLEAGLRHMEDREVS